VAEDAPSVHQPRHTPDPPDERGRSLRRAATITAGMGVVHAVLFLLRSIAGDVMLAPAVGGSSILGRISPNRGDGDQEAHP
jgi:hypothetical protein